MIKNPISFDGVFVRLNEDSSTMENLLRKLSWETQDGKNTVIESLIFKDDIGFYTYFGLIERLLCRKLKMPTKVRLDVKEDELIPLDGINLYDFQKAAAVACLNSNFGSIVAGTGCFTGDTKISLLNGTEVPIQDLSGLEEFWVYSCTSEGEIVPGRGHSARITKYIDEIYEITLDNGEMIRCTDNHQFMMRDGKYTEAKDLKISDSLMPLYRRITTENDYHKGYEEVLCNKNNNYFLTHMMVGDTIENEDSKPNLHHVDINRRNNSPDNLMWVTRSEHITIHNLLTSSDRLSKYHKDNPNNNMKQSLIDYIKNNPSHQSFAAKQVFKVHPELLGVSIIKYNQSEQGRNTSRKNAEHMRNLIEEKSEDEKQLIYLKRSLGTYSRNCKVRHSNTPLNCDLCKNNYLKRLNEVKSLDKNYNHSVVSIRKIKLDSKIPVWDISVDSYNNFALTSGVFVHNSGKSEIILSILRYLLDKTELKSFIIVVHSHQLSSNIFSRAMKRGFTKNEISDNLKDLGKVPIIVSVVNSLYSIIKNNRSSIELIRQCDCLVIDEAHHSGMMVRSVVDAAKNVSYRLGFTGTLYDADDPLSNFDDATALGILGETIYTISYQLLQDLGIISTPYVLMDPVFYKNKKGTVLKPINYQIPFNTVYDKFIVNNHERNSMAVRYVMKFHNMGFQSFVTVSRLEHANIILRMLKNTGIRALAVFGGHNGCEIDDTTGDVVSRPVNYEQVSVDYSDKKIDVLILSQVGDEGFDVPTVGLMIQLGGMKSKRKIIQRRGRGARKKAEGPNVFYLLDFWDRTHVYLLAQSKKRIKSYVYTASKFIESPEDFLNKAYQHSLILKEIEIKNQLVEQSEDVLPLEEG